MNRLTPGNLAYSGDRSVGEIFGQEYQGIEEGLHSGGRDGFGITYDLFDSVGPLAILGYAILVGAFVRVVLTIVTSAAGIIRDARVPIIATLYWGFGILLIEQGSMDNHISAMTREFIMGGLVLLFIQLVASAVQYQRLTRGLDTQSYGD